MRTFAASISSRSTSLSSPGLFSRCASWLTPPSLAGSGGIRRLPPAVANRAALKGRLASALARARRLHTTVACLLIGVEDFDDLRSLHDANAAELFRCGLAVRLGWHLGPRDVLARTGPGEFVAVLTGGSNEEHLEFVGAAMLAAASVPISIGKELVEFRMSIGLALAPDHAVDPEGLFSAAAWAMCRAKRMGGGLLVSAAEGAVSPIDQRNGEGASSER